MKSLATCIYCPNDATTNDHVPPQSFLRKPYPPNLLTIPACAVCNGSASKDEEYFRAVVIGSLCHTSEANTLFDDRMSPLMDRKPKVEDLMWCALKAEGESVILDVDYVRVFRVAEKIARGLQFSTTGRAYPQIQMFKVGFREVVDGNNETRLGPDFTYQRVTEGVGGWAFTFFDSVRFVVLAADQS